MLARMGYHVTGRLHAIFDAQQKTERFRVREFVLELSENPRYPQYVQFQLTGDRCESIDGYSVGDEVTVEFSLRGREWQSPRGETRYFNSLDVWTIERGAAGPPGDEPGPAPSTRARPSSGRAGIRKSSPITPSAHMAGSPRWPRRIGGWSRISRCWRWIDRESRSHPLCRSDLQIAIAWRGPAERSVKRHASTSAGM